VLFTRCFHFTSALPGLTNLVRRSGWHLLHSTSTRMVEMQTNGNLTGQTPPKCWRPIHTRCTACFANGKGKLRPNALNFGRPLRRRNMPAVSGTNLLDRAGAPGSQNCVGVPHFDCWHQLGYDRMLTTPPGSFFFHSSTKHYQLFEDAQSTPTLADVRANRQPRLTPHTIFIR